MRRRNLLRLLASACVLAACGTPFVGAARAATVVDTIFGQTTPTVIDSGDHNPVEVGVKFISSVNGTVSGIRFYKASTNVGVHVGTLWTANGRRLAQVTFRSETASGWQTASF